jgi:two-component system, OmpR family, sensor histidine kinase TctE
MARPTHSLQRTLLAFILLPLGLLLIANSLLTLNQSRTTAGLVTDHNLLASARVMAQGIHVVDGVTEAVISPSAIEMLASSEHDMVYYQLRAPNGAILAGQPDLTSDKTQISSDEAAYSDSIFRGQKIRIVQVRQQVVGQAAPGFATVTVGQTLAARDKLIRNLWVTSLMQQGLLVIVAAFLAWIGLKRSLAPLNRLRTAMGERRTGALTPLEAPQAPVEVQPLVTSLNDYIARLSLLMETQRRFVANAAHQLRTPLTLLKTQATFGLREETTTGKDEALNGVTASLDHLTRLTNQLLVLARAEPGTNHGARVDIDLVPIVQKLMENFAPFALDRNIDLGIELGNAKVVVHGNPTLLRELMSNLIDNALRYSLTDGVVTVKLAALDMKVVFTVEDSGPGIPPGERDRVFERFYRVHGASSEGSGLGLAIVAEIVVSHEGGVALREPESGKGLIVEVTLPAT